MWKVGTLDSGKPYLWRHPGATPEVQLWEEGRLDSGAPFWWRTDDVHLKDVRLTNPYLEAAGVTGPSSVEHDEL